MARIVCASLQTGTTGAAAQTMSSLCFLLAPEKTRTRPCSIVLTPVNLRPRPLLLMSGRTCFLGLIACTHTKVQHGV